MKGSRWRAFAARIRGAVRLARRWIGRAVSIYAMIIAVGMLPVNNQFQHAQGRDAVDVYFVSSSVHADVIVPLTNEPFGWVDRLAHVQFDGPTTGATHAAIGWGDKGFFIQTETWQDLRASTAARALLWPSDACMHVSLCNRPERFPDVQHARLTPEQYLQLCSRMDQSFRRDRENEAYQQIPDAGYGRGDAFFEADGAYHLLNTCNSWVGRVMQEGGLRTPWLTPLPRTAFLYLNSPSPQVPSRQREGSEERRTWISR